MAVQTSVSFIISLLSSVLIFAILQFCKKFFASSQAYVLLAGFIGSWFFMLLLTAISNFESLVLGKGFQARWLEVFLCLITACFACSTVHKVAITTCILFSCIGLFYLNGISQKFHAVAPVTAVDASLSKKKRK